MQYTAAVRETYDGNNVTSSIHLLGPAEGFGFTFDGNTNESPSMGIFSTNQPKIKSEHKFPKNTFYQLRCTFDWTYQSADGKYGIASAQYRLLGTEAWQLESDLQNIELHITDPTSFEKLLLRTEGVGGYLGEMDDIYVNYGENVTVHTIVLHPGENGVIDEANSGTDYTARIDDGLEFPTVNVTPDVEYIFVGFDPALPDTVIADFEATAVYAPKSCTVTFDAGVNGVITGGEPIQTVAYGSGAIAPIVLANDGYGFVGWDIAFDYVTANITVTAQYSENTFVVPDCVNKPLPESIALMIDSGFARGTITHRFSEVVAKDYVLQQTPLAGTTYSLSELPVAISIEVSVGRECEIFTLADANGDCAVDIADFAIFADYWLTNPI